MIKGTLVLEGGATRGVFTAGVLDYLMERDVYFSHVIGVSAGACNGADYVSKQPGRTKDCMIPTDKSGNYYYGPRKAFKKRSLMNMDLIFEKFPKEIFPFDFDTYFHSEIDVEYVVTNCRTGKAEYHNERKDKDRLLKLVRASCSLPLLGPVVNVDDTPYLDGGLADGIPLERAMEKGNDKIVVVLTKNLGYRKSRVSNALKRLYRRGYRSFPNLIGTILLRPMKYNYVIRQLEELEAAGKVFVIRPQIKLIGRMERNQRQLKNFFHHGYRLMEKEYDNLMAFLESDVTYKK